MESSQNGLLSLVSEALSQLHPEHYPLCLKTTLKLFKRR